MRREIRVGARQEARGFQGTPWIGRSLGGFGKGIFSSHIWFPGWGHLLRTQAGLGTDAELLISRTWKERLGLSKW
jgi:hypothetical protein